jgi:hypothetical protein
LRPRLSGLPEAPEAQLDLQLLVERGLGMADTQPDTQDTSACFARYVLSMLYDIRVRRKEL